MDAALPHFDYDQLSDNVRSFVRATLRDEATVANALTFAQGEELVQKLTSIAISESRKVPQPYLERVEEIVEGLEKAAVAQPEG
jgi:hypothetical protein